MPVFLHDPDLVDNQLLPAPFAERHLLQGHLEGNWRPRAGEILQESTMTTGRVFLEWWGWAVPNCPVTLCSDTRAQEATGQQLISPLAWMPLARDILPSKPWNNFPKLSPTDLWQHPAPTFFPNGLSLSPLLSFTQVLQAGFCDCENKSKQMGILQQFHGVWPFFHYLHNKANTCTHDG